MAAKGTNVKIVDEIKRLQGMGFGKRRIARTLKIHRDTVSKILENNPHEKEFTYIVFQHLKKEL